jgi:hypothetical protein
MKAYSMPRFIPLLAALISSSAAFAVPLRVDFAGTVRETNVFTNGLNTPDPSNNGLAFSASFFIETEGLTATNTVAPSGTTLRFADAIGGLELITSLLTINGIAYDVGFYGNDTGAVQFIDSAGPVSCGVGCTQTVPDQFQFSDSSSELLLGPGAPRLAPGIYRSRSLFLTSSPLNLDILNPASATGYFDLNPGISAASAITLPLGLLGSAFTESTTTCTATSCFQNINRVTVFNVASVSRSVVSVPEPALAWWLAPMLLLFTVHGRKRAKIR